MISRHGPYLVVLSAKNERRLSESATRLRDHLKAQSNVDLDRLAYTLQVGRESMDERLAVVISSANELLNELSAYVAGAASSKVVVGRVEPHRKSKRAKQEGKEREKSLFERGDLDALAQMWVEGHSIEWDEVYVGHCPYQLPLPTYPFAKERYWVSDPPIPEKRMAGRPRAVQTTAKLHPLVCRNVSTLKEVCF